MATYAFSIDIEGNAIQGIKQLEAHTEALEHKAKEAHVGFHGLGEKVRELGGELKGLALGALGIGSMFAGFEFIKTSKEAFDKLEESVTKVETALESTRGAAQLSMQELTKGAKEVAGTTLFSRASIMDAQSMLLTFTSIRGEIFNKTIPAITDFATRFNMDLPEAAKTLGKALNDPLRGMTRLQRQGVVFSNAQKETIKQFMATGQVARAQQVILSELSTEFGGLAHAMTQTDEGKLKMEAKRLDNFKLSVGELTSKFLVSLIPAFNKVVEIAKGFYHWITGDSESAYIFKEAIIVIGVVLGSYLTIIGAVTIATKAWTAVTWLLDAAMAANPIGLVIAAVTALIIGIAALWDKCEGFRKAVGGIFAEIAKVVMGLVHVFIGLGKIVADVFTLNFTEFKKDSKDFINNFKDDFTKGWGDAWNKGSEQAKNSKFTFGGLIGLDGKKQDEAHKPKAGEAGEGPPNGSLAQSAINTSALAGASGGLGEAKVIHIDFHKALMEIIIQNGNANDIIGKAPLTIDILLRYINNLSHSQGTM
jgi:hypothetical protein